jgi:tRNA dimethylallyltransferase
LPIVTGGTGLYFKALTGGLSQIPPINPAIRAQWRERVGAEPAALLHAELSRRDPDTALKLHPTDTQRIIRALEVLDSTGKTLAHWQSSKSEPLLTLQDTAPIVLMQDRNELYLRCDERFEAMLDMGALAEAETLLAMNLDRGLPALRAVGLPPLLDYLQGKSGLNDAVERAKTDTRHYVKRQITWLNRNINLHQLVYTQFNERTKDDLLRFIRQRLTAPQKRFTHHPPKQKA